MYGETANETLIRELLARGYNRNQIMAVEGMYKGTADGRGFLVKGLKEKDAVELAKIFGQESVTTNKGLLNVKRPTRKVKQTVNGQNVVDADGNIQFDDVGYKVGAKKNEITSVAYNLRSQGKGNVLYGKDALATDYSTSIMSKNNDELSFSYLIDFAEDVGLRNPTMSKKQQLIRADEILLKSSEKVTGNKNFTLYKEIKALEKEAGLLTKSPLDQRHTALKVNVFGKKSLTEMTDDELQQYKALIDNQPSYTTKLHDENGGILFDNNPVIGNFKKFMNRIMPVSTKFGNLGRELGSEALVKIETDLTQMTRLREEIKGTYRASRNDMNKKYDFYDLTKEERDKMKLSGWNLGHLQGHLFNNSNVYPPTDFKPIDVCAIYQAEHKENYEHTFRNDIPYTEHRKGAWDILDTGTFKCITEQLPYEQYISNLYSSKVCLSPFGMGEICFRDFEVMALNTLLIKPDMSMVITKPNIYIDGETYFGVQYDWSNLNEVIQSVMDNFEDINTEMCYNAGKLWNKLYTANDYIQHYYDLFKDLENINEEENG